MDSQAGGSSTPTRSSTLSPAPSSPRAPRSPRSPRPQTISQMRARLSTAQLSSRSAARSLEREREQQVVAADDARTELEDCISGVKESLTESERLLECIGNAGELWSHVGGEREGQGADRVSKAVSETFEICEEFMKDMRGGGQLIGRIEAVIDLLDGSVTEEERK